MYPTNQNIKELVPFLWVRNMQQSLVFYVDKLDFKLVEKWVHQGKIKWCRLEKEGVALMLQESNTDKKEAAPTNHSSNSRIDLYFICHDALAIYKTIKNRLENVNVPFVGNQMWVVEFNDPDGYRIIFESATQEKEGSQFK